MSEIKGQLLGIVLVIMIFAVVSTTIASIFVDTKDTIAFRAQYATQGSEEILEYTDPLPPSNTGSH